MKTTIEKTEKLISSLKRRKYFNSVSCFYKQKETFWDFYFNITGFLNEDYFSINIMKSKSNTIEIIEISETTDCKEEIRKLLNKFEIYEK